MDWNRGGSLSLAYTSSGPRLITRQSDHRKHARVRSARVAEEEPADLGEVSIVRSLRQRLSEQSQVQHQIEQPQPPPMRTENRLIVVNLVSRVSWQSWGRSISSPTRSESRRFCVFSRGLAHPVARKGSSFLSSNAVHSSCRGTDEPCRPCAGPLGHLCAPPPCGPHLHF
uniref:Uncharacterized protein n=1 Tax=Knipowitschia caucasica TaxID=637954 RepID=A0AAV2MHC7_KNICA